MAHGYKQGLQVRNSLDKALKEQGIDGATSRVGHSTHNWQEAEKNAVERVMDRYGWERAEESDLKRKHLTVDQYKAVASEIENQIAVLPEQITAKSVPMSKDKVIVSKSDLESLEKRAKLSIVHEEATKSMEDKVLKRSEAHVSYIDYHQNQMKLEALALLKEKEKYARLNQEQLTLKKENTNLKLTIENLKEENTLLKNKMNILIRLVAKSQRFINKISNWISNPNVLKHVDNMINIIVDTIVDNFVSERKIIEEYKKELHQDDNMRKNNDISL